MAKKEAGKKDLEEQETMQAEEVGKQSSAEDKLRKEMEELKTENEEISGRMLRLRADFENFRKRTVKERAEIARRANENLLSEIIPALDHFEMGFETARESDVPESVIAGFKLVYDQLMKAIEKVGVVRIDAEGEEFNPHLHECISHIPSADVPEGVVSAQTRCGYKIDNYILRAAQVVVSSGSPSAAKEDDSANTENENQGEE